MIQSGTIGVEINVVLPSWRFIVQNNVSDTQPSKMIPLSAYEGHAFLMPFILTNSL
jgi:hypothetical protein